MTAAGLNGHGVMNGVAVLRPEWADTGEPPKRFALEWAATIQTAQEEWLVKGALPSRGLGCIYGPSRAGKSFLAIEWAMRIACGMDVLEFRTRRAGVAYVGAEAPNGIRKRILAWMKHHHVQDDQIPLALIPTAPNLADPNGTDVSALIHELQAADIEFREEGAALGLVIVDTFARATAGADENAGSEMGAAIAALERIGNELGVLVCPVHHTGKNAALGMRGHSSFFAALDCAIELSHDEDSGLRRLRIAKQKDGEDGAEQAFRLHPVEIGADSDGDPISSCVVHYVEEDGGEPQRPLPADQQLILTALDAVLSNGHGRRPPHGVPCPANREAAPLNLVREHAFKIGLSKEGDKPSTPRMRFSRAQEKLCASNRTRVWSPEKGDEWIWRV